MSVAALLRRRGLAALLASEVVSMSGTAMTLVALPWFVLATTGSPARTSIVMAGAAAGLAVCGIPGGWVAIDAGSYVLAFAVTSLIPAAVKIVGVVEDPQRFADGVRFLSRDAFLRFYVPVIAVWEAAASALVFVLFPVIAFIRYDRDAHVAGALLGAIGAGAIAGSVVAYRIVPRFRPVRLGAVTTLLQTLPLWVLVFEVPALAAVAATSVYGFFQPIWFSSTFSPSTGAFPLRFGPP
jgi:hypothetical protein